MEEYKPNMDTIGVAQSTKDETLCEAIEKVLREKGPQRVLLAGEAGIGKTRLARKVGEYVVRKELSFLTICVHLNQKFDDEWSLYENIASQLSVYSDFEETEVDDRDEEEEEENKDSKVLLADLKKKIVEEIEKRRKVLADKVEKREKDLAEKREKDAKKRFGDGGNQTGVGKDNLTVTEKPAKVEPYLLLILDDEGNKTSEDKVMKDLKLEEGNKTSEDKVMKKLELGLEMFLREQNFLKNNENGLKILVTRRKGDEEPSKPDGENVSKDSKSEKGDGSNSGENQEEEDDESKNEPEDEIKSDDDDDDDDEKNTESAARDNAKVSKPGGESVPTPGDEEPSKLPTKCYNVIPFCTNDMSHVLRESITEKNLKELFASITKEDWETYKKFVPAILEKSKNSPAAIVVLAKSLKRVTPRTSDPERKKDLQHKIDEKIQEVFSAERSASDQDSSSSESGINPVMSLAYELLETDGPLKDTILDCFWHSLDFFEHCGCVYYRDLITQWLLEGYFDPVRSVEKAYQDGHSILMELINRGMLKIQENNVVVPEMAMSNLIDRRTLGLRGRSRLRFSNVYVGDKKKGIGKINQIDDMIKTVQAKKGDKISTILVSGDRLRRETLMKYFKKLDDLEVLGLFEPTVDRLVPALLELQKHLVEKKKEEEPYKELRVLVIRDCDLLEDIKDLITFRQLQVLEVSGASSLKEIDDDFFTEMPDLESLHLSGLQIKHSPSTISGLKKLHCLIIKDCPLLEDLPNIQGLLELEVVDISGARGLKTCFDNTSGNTKDKSKNKNFYKLEKLQHLDFSESQIERLPIFQDSADPKKLHLLTRLLLRNCSKLRRLPSLKPLSGLQILDLSGTTSLVEMLEVCFEDKKELISLNLTGTNLGELATTIDELSSLEELLLKDCTKLEEIPSIQNLTNLEVVDVSGCTKLKKIEGSFENMFYLREVNLSGSKVMITPEFLPKESKINIRCQKRFTQADGRVFKGDKWSDVKAAMMQKEISDKASSSGEVVETQEISEKESKEVGETQPKKFDKASSSGEVVDTQEIAEKVSEGKGEIQTIESRTRDCTENVAVRKERLHQVPITTDIYKKILSCLNTVSQQEVMKVHESKDLAKEAVADGEFVSFVDISSTRLTSIFNETKSVKSCSLWMCMDIKDLFSGVDVESLGSLEILTITNLPLLETICWGESCKNLKTLSIECCPKIKILFTEASQLPSSLKELHVKNCEKLEEVLQGLEQSTFPSLTWKVENCPNFKGNPQGSGYVVIDDSEITQVTGPTSTHTALNT